MTLWGHQQDDRHLGAATNLHDIDVGRLDRLDGRRVL